MPAQPALAGARFTSAGGVMPANGESAGNAASASGVSHASALPSVREPGPQPHRHKSSASFARRGPAKRTSRPPSSSQRSQRGAIGRRDAAGVRQDQRLRARIDQLARARRAASSHTAAARDRRRTIPKQRLPAPPGSTKPTNGRPAPAGSRRTAPALCFAHDAHPRRARRDLRRQFNPRRSASAHRPRS